LAVAFSALSELEFKMPVFVEDLDAMVVGVSNNNVVLCIDRNPGWFSKLT
jgi:hypothetical protein